MSQPIRFLWLDDARPPAEGGPWHWVQSAEEALEILRAGSVIEASLDHDLEFPVDRQATGAIQRASYVAGAKNGTWLAEQMVKFGALPCQVYLHSTNRDAARGMADILKNHVPVRYRRAPHA